MKRSQQIDILRAKVGMIDAIVNSPGTEKERAERVRHYVTTMLDKKRFKATMENVEAFRKSLEEELKTLEGSKIQPPKLCKETESDKRSKTSHKRVKSSKSNQKPLTTKKKPKKAYKAVRKKASKKS